MCSIERFFEIIGVLVGKTPKKERDQIKMKRIDNNLGCIALAFWERIGLKVAEDFFFDLFFCISRN